MAAAAALHEGLAGGVVGINQEGATTLSRAYAIVVATSWIGMSHLNRLTAYRVTILRGNNLPLTWSRHFWQLMGRNCSCLLPRQDGITSQIEVNRRF